MRCRYCNNDIKIVKNSKYQKVGCCLEGCLTYNLDYRTKQYRILVLGRDEEETNKRIKERIEKTQETLRESGYYDDKSNNPFSRDYWLKQGYSKEEVDIKLKTKAKMGANTKRKSGYYDNKSNNPFSREYWANKGLSGADIESKIRNRIVNTPDYWISRGYSYEDSVSLSYKFAAKILLENLKETYGDELGTRKYLEIRKKIKENTPISSMFGKNFGTSKEASKFFLRLYRYCRRLGYERNDFFFQQNRGEYFINDKEGIHFYDFLIKPLKLIIEYNGEHVHPNKDKLTESQWNEWKHAFSKESANDVYKRSQIKYNKARQRGFVVIEVWSKDKQNYFNVCETIKEHHAKRESKEAIISN